MSKDESFGYVVFGISLGLGVSIILMSVVLVVGEFRTNYFALLIIYPISVSALAILYGLRQKRRMPQYERSGKKSRLAAMLMAWAPGKGHDYLGHPKQGIIFLVPLVVGVLITVLAIPMQMRYFVFYGAVFMIFSVIWSCIDVNRICDEMALPYSKGIFGSQMEIHFKRSDVLEVVAFVVIGLMLFGTGYIIMTDPMAPLPDEDYIPYFNFIGIMLPAAVLIKHLAIRLSAQRKAG